MQLFIEKRCIRVINCLHITFITLVKKGLKCVLQEQTSDRIARDDSLFATKETDKKGNSKSKNKTALIFNELKSITLLLILVHHFT